MDMAQSSSKVEALDVRGLPIIGLERILLPCIKGWFARIIKNACIELEASAKNNFIIFSYSLSTLSLKLFNMNLELIIFLSNLVNIHNPERIL